MCGWADLSKPCTWGEGSFGHPARALQLLHKLTIAPIALTHTAVSIGEDTEALLGEVRYMLPFMPL